MSGEPPAWTDEDIAAVDGVFAGIFAAAASSTPDPLCDPSTSRGEEPYAPKDWRQLRAIVLHRDGYTCQECGAAATVVDHIWPKSKGGADKLSNLQALCAPCNGSKGDSLRLIHVTHDRLLDAARSEMDTALRSVQQAARWREMAAAVADLGQIPLSEMATIDRATQTPSGDDLRAILHGVAKALGVTP